VDGAEAVAPAYATIHPERNAVLCELVARAVVVVNHLLKE
jgi:hypothetical protein